MQIINWNGYNVYIQEKNNLSVRLLQTSGSLLPLSQIISTEGEVVSITNCSYFFSEGSYNYTNGRNQGDTLNTTYADSDNGKYCDICIYEDGSWYAGKFNNWDHTENYRDVENGVCAGFSVACFLVLNGVDEYSYSTAFNGDKASARNPQTAFVILSDGNMLQVVSDGRNDVGNGLTGYELLECVRAQGYNNIQVFALLDGGGSSEMIVNGEIVNTPSDGTERKMLNGIAFVDIAAEEPEPEEPEEPTPEPKDISKATILLSQTSYEYTGEECKPDVTVILNDVTLIQDTDYTVSYESNINPGRAIVRIKGINNYTGSTAARFEIQKISILNNVVVEWAEEAQMCVYTGDPFEPDFKVLYKGNELVQGQDYAKEYFNNIHVSSEAFVRIVGLGVFQGEMIDYFSIWERDINEANFSMDTTEYVYTGEAIIPTFSLNYNNKDLIKDTDYTIEVSNNIEVGIATMTIQGIGDFWEFFEVDFEIKVKDIAEPDVYITAATVPIYTGEPVLPKLDIFFNGISLKEGIDYTLNAWDNINAGVGYLKIIGINNFTNEKEISFNIAQASLDKQSSDFTIQIMNKPTYNGLAQLPDINILYLGKELIEDEDYFLEGENNIDATTQAVVIITGKGNFKDSKRQFFTILPSTGDTFELIFIDGDEYLYTAKEICPSVKLLLNGEEYDKMYSIAYVNNINVSEEGATVTVTITGNYEGTISKKFKISPASIENCIISVKNAPFVYENIDITPSLRITFNGVELIDKKDFDIIKYENNINVTNEAKIYYKFITDNFIEKDKQQSILFSIVQRSISSCVVTLKETNFTYTGNSIEPVFDVSIGSKVVAIENYSFEYLNNINASSSALIVLTGLENLKGQKSVFFKINPAQLTEENCEMRAQEYEEGSELYNLDTLQVFYVKPSGEKTRLYSVKSEDYQKDYPEDFTEEFFSEKNLSKEIVETTVSITGKNNYTGIVRKIFATGTISAGDLSDSLSQIDRKPGYTYINYSKEMEGMFKISSQGKSAIDELNTQLYNHGYVNESVTINAVPIYYLKPNTIVYIRDEETKINGEYVISKINIPLGNSGTMSVTATKAMKRIY